MGRAIRTRTPQTSEEGQLIQQQVEVTAILVCHRASKHLATVLNALENQTRQLDHLIVVESAIDEDLSRLLEEHIPEPAHRVSLRENQGFTAAVAHAASVAQDLAHKTPDDRHWLWLIHDDSAPAPNALEELLGRVEISPSVTIAGCKQVQWNDERKLIDVGVGMSPRAERLPLINNDELDQHQYDARTDVFAVNSAGMLIRADSWEALNGFDPALNMVGDDLDICLRNRLNGNRVIVVPSAIMRHDQPTAEDIDKRNRPVSGSWFGSKSAKSGYTTADKMLGRVSPSGIWAQRRSQTFLRLKFTPAWKVPFLWLFLLFASFGELIGGIASKKIAHSLRAWAGSLAGMFKPIQLARSRAQAKKTKKVSSDVVTGMMISRREAVAYHRANAAVVEPTTVIGDGTGLATQVYEPTGDREDFAAMATPERTWAGTGAVAAVVLLGILSIVLLRHIVGATALIGGSMLPVSTSLSSVFAHAVSWFTDLSVGSAHHVDPFSYVLFFLGVLGLGNASAATVVSFLVALPLAGLAAWFLAAGVTDSRGLRLLAAFSWGLMPPLQVALAQGRLASVIFHLVLPLFVLALIRAVGAGLDPKLYLDPVAMRRREVEMVLHPGINSVPSWTAAATASLLLAVLAACAPATTLPLLIAVLVMFVVMGRRAKTLWFVPLPALALFMPVWVIDYLNPRALLGDPTVPQAFESAPLWQQLLGMPVAFTAESTTPLFYGWAPGSGWALSTILIIMIPLLVGLAGSLFLPGLRGNIVRFTFAGALVVVIFSQLTGSIVVASDAGQPVTIFPGPAISVWTLATLLGAVVLLDAVGRKRNRSSVKQRSLWTSISGVLIGAMTLSVLLAGTTSVATSFRGASLATGDTAGAVENFGMNNMLRASGERLVPATAADQALGPYRTRTLRITPTSNGFDGALINGAATNLDAMSAGHHARQFTGGLFEARWADSDPADEHIRNAVAQIVAGENLDPRDELNELAVGFVYLLDANGEQELIAGRIDAVPGLASVGRTDEGWLWRAVPDETLPDAAAATDFTSRMRIVDESGQTLQRVESSLSEATLKLEENDQPRALVISNRAHPNWHVYFNGRELPQTTAQSSDEAWATHYELPEGEGVLRIEFRNPYQTVTVIGQALVFGLALLLAVPVRVRSRVVPQQVASSTPADSKQGSTL